MEQRRGSSASIIFESIVFCFFCSVEIIADCQEISTLTVSISNSADVFSHFESPRMVIVCGRYNILSEYIFIYISVTFEKAINDEIPPPPRPQTDVLTNEVELLQWFRKSIGVKNKNKNQTEE